MRCYLHTAVKKLFKKNLLCTMIEHENRLSANTIWQRFFPLWTLTWENGRLRDLNGWTTALGANRLLLEKNFSRVPKYCRICSNSNQDTKRTWTSNVHSSSLGNTPSIYNSWCKVVKVRDVDRKSLKCKSSFNEQSGVDLEIHPNSEFIWCPVLHGSRVSTSVFPLSTLL